MATIDDYIEDFKDLVHRKRVALKVLRDVKNWNDEVWIPFTDATNGEVYTAINKDTPDDLLSEILVVNSQFEIRNDANRCLVTARWNVDGSLNLTLDVDRV